MPEMIPIDRPRPATEDDVAAALHLSTVGPLPATAAALSEFHNRTIDVLTGEVDRAGREDRERIDRAMNRER